MMDAVVKDNAAIVIVMDNASVHKSHYINSVIKGKTVRIMTIHPYRPSLNLAKELILSIKTKKYSIFKGK